MDFKFGEAPNNIYLMQTTITVILLNQTQQFIYIAHNFYNQLFCMTQKEKKEIFISVGDVSLKYLHRSSSICVYYLASCMYYSNTSLLLNLIAF